MKINISKKQYEDLIMVTELSNWVLGILSDYMIEGEGANYKDIYKKSEKLQQYILSFAEDFNLADKIDSHKEDIFLNEEEADKYNEITNDYDEYVFWRELENRFARREFYQTITEKEKKELENNTFFPKRFFYIEDKYRQEFEENGIDNLALVKI